MGRGREAPAPAPTLTSHAPSGAFSFVRTVAIVLFIIGAAGAIEAMPTSGSVPDSPATASLTQTLKSFFTRLWSPGVSEAEKLGTAYIYGEDGSLLSETGTGGANSGGTVNYIYLPTANGPMPVAAEINGQLYAVHSDHLNTPRRLTDSHGQVAWQWAYSAFGDEKPTIAANRFANLDINPSPGTTHIAPVEFNLRYQNHYADKESGLFENRNRFYHPPSGRYTQGDAYGLGAGPNRFIYALGDPLGVFDDDGLAPKKPSGIAPAPFSPLAGGTVKPSPVPGWEPLQIGVLGGARAGGGGRGSVAPSCPPQGLEAARGVSRIVAEDGTAISGLTRHGVDRVIGDGRKRAGTRPESILDALKDPKTIKEGVDSQGRPFKIFQGEDARVVVNPETGRIISTNPLSGAGAH